MLQLKVLILELFAVDGFPSGTVAFGKVTTLDHEPLNHTMEAGAFEGEGLAGLASALLARAECTEVLGSFGDNVIVLQCNTLGKLEPSLMLHTEVVQSF